MSGRTSTRIQRRTPTAHNSCPCNLANPPTSGEPFAPVGRNEAHPDRGVERMRGIEPPMNASARGYLAWARNVKRLAPLTLEAYSDTLAALEQHVDGRDWCDVDSDCLIAFITRPRRHGQAPAASTQRRDHAVCKQFFLYLTRVKVIDQDPMWMVPPPKVTQAGAKPISDTAWLTLWANPRLGVDDRFWLGLGYFAGLRRSEMATVGPECVDIDRRQMRFRRKGGSTEPIEVGAVCGLVGLKLPHLRPSAERWVDVFDTMVRARHADTFLVSSMRGNPKADGNWFNKRLVTLRRQSGLASVHFTPHCLRHSAATNLLRSGAPIEVTATQLSHASIETTRGYLATGGQLERLQSQGQV